MGLGPAFTNAAKTEIPGAEIHFAAALGLRGKDRFYAGENKNGRDFRRIRALGTKDYDGFAALKVIKGQSGEIFEPLT